MVRRLRLVSGLVLFAYLLTHALNHTLGLVSLEALEAGTVYRPSRIEFRGLVTRIA